MTFVNTECWTGCAVYLGSSRISVNRVCWAGCAVDEDCSRTLWIQCVEQDVQLRGLFHVFSQYSVLDRMCSERGLFQDFCAYSVLNRISSLQRLFHDFCEYSVLNRVCKVVAWLLWIQCVEKDVQFTRIVYMTSLNTVCRTGYAVNKDCSVTSAKIVSWTGCAVNESCSMTSVITVCWTGCAGLFHDFCGYSV